MTTKSQPKKKLSTSNGFTLIEMLVALAIISMISVLSWQGLNTVIRIYERIEKVDNELSTVRAIFNQLENDLEHVPDNNWEQLQPNQQPKNANPQDTLDHVVQASLSSLDRISINQEGLFILNNTIDHQMQPVNQRIIWRWANGALGRQVTQSTMLNNPNIVTPTKNLSLHNLREDKINLKGFGISFWIEKRGWNSEKIYGDFGQLKNNASTENHPLWSANTAKEPVNNNLSEDPQTGSGIYRVKGVRIRLMMPSGEIFSRVFWVGTAS
jgi:prepilin-type N-terminal cleavage/methylation domain-containing protein